MKSFVAICLSLPILGQLMLCFPRGWWVELSHPNAYRPTSAYVIALFFVLVFVASVLGEVAWVAIGRAGRRVARFYEGWSRQSWYHR